MSDTHQETPCWHYQIGNTYFMKMGSFLTADLILDQDGNWIGAVWQDVPGGVREQESNGRLMAAAPDLLAACEDMLAVLHKTNISKKTVADQARAAIAKAKGE